MSNTPVPNPTPKRSEMTFGIMADRVPSDLVDNVREGCAILHPEETRNKLVSMDADLVGMRRSTIDATEAVRQLILYTPLITVERETNELLFAVYCRGKGADGRLEGAYSIGFGGHLELPDVRCYVETDVETGEQKISNTPSTFHSLLESGIRELNEEVQLTIDDYRIARRLISPFGFISDVRSDEKGWVGNTHLCVLSAAVPDFDISRVPDMRFDFQILDERYTKVGWMTQAQLIEEVEKFESWSKLIINNLEAYVDGLGVALEYEAQAAARAELQRQVMMQAQAAEQEQPQVEDKENGNVEEVAQSTAD